MRGFLMREMIEESSFAKVTRTRTSTGYAAITVQIVDGPSFTFTNENDAEYENKAWRLSWMIDNIADAPCDLPDVK